MWYDNGYSEYVPVGTRIANAKKQVLRKLGDKMSPLPKITGRKIAKTFWGNAWCENLEAYADWENRLPRGMTYVKNGSVVHLEIARGVVKSFVAGTSVYEVEITIKPLAKERWSAIKQKCTGQIGTVVELLQGKLSDRVMSVVTDPAEGLFPAPTEIRLGCSCPDWAMMCKHIAATLYGVGALLDERPELLFTLRGVDHLELIDSNVALLPGTEDAGTLDASSLEDIFGVQLADSLEAEPSDVSRQSAQKPKPVKKAAKKTVASPEKTAKPAKVVKKSPKKAAKKAVKKVVATAATPVKTPKSVKKAAKTPAKTSKPITKPAAKVTKQALQAAVQKSIAKKKAKKR